MTEDDAGVIGRSVGEPEVFAAIFDRHAPYLHRYLARRLGRDVADDALAETFLAAFRRRARYDRQRPDARPWLYGIATNVVAQHRRDEVREYRLLRVVRPQPHAEAHDDDVAARVVAEARGPELGAALAALADGDRDVVLLTAAEGLSYEEVAEALGIPVGTVRSRLNRARRKLRAALGTDSEEVSVHG
ncbi:RNA polymerase sigma factor [Amycolatopsis benzoatilytica]|uniref:RNA polymerase sigma factor n=1 Tax=Amycolatopsis benzoatilytica TaxID=346045 RepID=UPI00035DFD18|nr:RNA polymerase sigma factor [Amycolatopsis benzoatilytica]